MGMDCAKETNKVENESFEEDTSSTEEFTGLRNFTVTHTSRGLAENHSLSHSPYTQKTLSSPFRPLNHTSTDAAHSVTRRGVAPAGRAVVTGSAAAGAKRSGRSDEGEPAPAGPRSWARTGNTNIKAAPLGHPADTAQRHVAARTLA
jgi:hypothetical protein